MSDFSLITVCVCVRVCERHVLIICYRIYPILDCLFRSWPRFSSLSQSAGQSLTQWIIWLFQRVTVWFSESFTHDQWVSVWTIRSWLRFSPISFSKSVFESANLRVTTVTHFSLVQWNSVWISETFSYVSDLLLSCSVSRVWFSESFSQDRDSLLWCSVNRMIRGI